MRAAITRDAVPDPGGSPPGRRRAGAGGGVDVGAGDQSGGAAAGDRTRPGRRRPSGCTGSGGPVRVHPTPARHDGEDHRRAAGGTSRGVFRVSPASRRVSEGERGRTHQGPDQGRHPRRTDHRPDHRRCYPGGGPAGDDQRCPAGTLARNPPTPRPWTMPAFLARRIITRDPDATAARVWVRRLLTDPIDDTVATVDTKRRRFDGALAVLINARDQVCRDPYCSAPHPGPRPPPRLRERWAHVSRQRRRALSTREPRRPDPRLAHHRHRQTPGGDHPHRTPLRHPTTTSPRTPTTRTGQTGWANPTRGLGGIDPDVSDGPAAEVEQFIGGQPEHGIRSAGRGPEFAVPE